MINTCCPSQGSGMMSSCAQDNAVSPPLPKLIIGTSCLGNLYTDIGYEAKKAILAEVMKQAQQYDNGLVLDCAGKYGCGLALETIGSILKELEVPPSKVRISNKLGWRRIPLNNGNPSSCVRMEPGVWMHLDFDAELDISYDGILACFEEGNGLLGDYVATLVSVHDPDDYLSDAKSCDEREQRKKDILGAYQCLRDLKSQNKVESIGIGVKNPEIIEYLLQQGVHLDWTMLAGVLTPYVHTIYTRTVLKTLRSKNIQVINSAVFNSGFLVGEEYYNYVLQDPLLNMPLYEWRQNFYAICQQHQLSPAHVCVQFSFLFTEIQCVALNASRLEHVALNFHNIYAQIPKSHNIWKHLSDANLIDIH